MVVSNPFNLYFMTLFPQFPDNLKVFSLFVFTYVFSISHVNDFLQFLLLIITFIYTLYKAANERKKYKDDEEKI